MRLRAGGGSYGESSFGNGRIALVVLAAAVTLAGPVIAAEWLAGDLHMHSVYSDGHDTVAEIVADAVAKDLDFIALTDHDEPDGDTSHWADPDYVSDRLILLYGVEWTCIFGHATFLATERFDYQPMWEANLAFAPKDAYAAAVKQGVTMSIAHPRRPGFNWILTWDESPLMEIWNGKTSYPVHADVAFWEEQLSSGRRVVGIGGSDMHCLNGEAADDCPVDSIIGGPTTWVYAERRKESVFDAIVAGRVTISATPTAPRLVIEADEGIIKVHLENVDSESTLQYLLEIHDDAECAHRERIGAADIVTFQMKPDRLFYRAELYGDGDHGSEGRLLALTNPVYVADAPPLGEP